MGEMIGVFVVVVVNSLQFASKSKQKMRVVSHEVRSEFADHFAYWKSAFKLTWLYCVLLRQIFRLNIKRMTPIL